MGRFGVELPRKSAGPNTGHFFSTRPIWAWDLGNFSNNKNGHCGELNPASDELLFMKSGRGFKSLER